MEKTTLTRISKIAMAFAFSFVVCALAAEPARADPHHGRGGGAHHEEHHGGHGRGGGHVAPMPDYYYAPPTNYYTAPEPSYYYAPGPVYSEPPPPSQGISLFFGF
ncbi:MAG: hypothetical protein ACLQU2_12940 [Candidatus Binataceae bacterium]